MKLQKCLIIVMLFALLSTNLVAEERTSSSVESVYLQASEDIIVSELAVSDKYEAKLLSLEYIKDAVNGGRVSPAITQALYSLSGEGVTTIAREAGRIANNYPDIRREATLLLANVKDVETKDVLLDLVLSEKEPMVLAAAVFSLGEIGVIENDDVVNEIAHMNKRLAVLNPTDSIALATIEAFEKFLPQVENKNILIEAISSIATNYSFAMPTREKAKETLITISQY